jgi:hypothetical protein
MERVRVFTINLRDRIFHGFLILGLIWIVVAFLLQLSAVFLQFSGNEKLLGEIVNRIEHRIDGRFKNSPGNMWYNEEEHIWVESVVNNVKIGKLAGNRNLEFGVKNMLEEYLQEKEYELTPSAKNKLKVEIVYLDVLTTKKNVSVFHKNEEEVVIRLKGILYKDGKKEKEIIVEESSSEISMSTLIVDEGGQFNQTSLSNALKKSCDKLITKLFQQN